MKSDNVGENNEINEIEMSKSISETLRLAVSVLD